MFRAHVTKVTTILLLTLALGVVAAPAQAAGFSAERSSRWEQLVESLFDWLLSYCAGIDPDGRALCSMGAGGGNTSSADINPAGKKGSAPSAGAAALCLDTTSCIDPNGRQ